MQTIIGKHPIILASNGQDVEFTFSPLLGIVIAAVLGGAVGIQRQAAAKPAGFRTHILVAAAAAAFTAMGAHLHDTRIPSYIIVGIGFLGSGAIVRHEGAPLGLTTAASIWMAAAIGLSLGYSNSFGLYVGLLATAITLFTLVLSDDEIMRMFRIPVKATIRVTAASPAAAASEIQKLFAGGRIQLESSEVVSVTSESGTEIAEIVYVISVPRDLDVGTMVRNIGALSSVRRVECSEPFFGA